MLNRCHGYYHAMHDIASFTNILSVSFVLYLMLHLQLNFFFQDKGLNKLPNIDVPNTNLWILNN